MMGRYYASDNNFCAPEFGNTLSKDATLYKTKKYTKYIIRTKRQNDNNKYNKFPFDRNSPQQSKMQSGK